MHFGKGLTEASIKLAPGDYKLTMQFADGLHCSYGKKWAATISIKALLKNGNRRRADGVIHSGEIVIWSEKRRRRTRNARRAFRRRELRALPERFSGRTYRTGDSGHRPVFHHHDIAGAEGNRRVAHRGVAGSSAGRERRVMGACGGAHLPAFAVNGNFGRARIVRLPSCTCGREREAGKTPRAGVSGAGESSDNLKSTIR